MASTLPPEPPWRLHAACGILVCVSACTPAALSFCSLYPTRSFIYMHLCSEMHVFSHVWAQSPLFHASLTLGASQCQLGPCPLRTYLPLVLVRILQREAKGWIVSHFPGVSCRVMGTGARGGEDPWWPQAGLARCLCWLRYPHCWSGWSSHLALGLACLCGLPFRSLSLEVWLDLFSSLQANLF